MIGILLCILLLTNTTKGTGIRFGIWIGIGHIVYFAYGFRHSQQRLRKKEEMYASGSDLVPPIYFISSPSDLDLQSEVKLHSQSEMEKADAQSDTDEEDTQSELYETEF